MAETRSKDSKTAPEEGGAPAAQSKGQDLRVRLDEIEQRIDELKIQYEQFFLAVTPLPPDKLHGIVKRELRALQKAPFKSSALQFRLRTIWNRYQTLATYWQRVLRERESGTYSRDVFKADMRERHALEDQRAQTQVGKAEKGFQQLFQSYKSALEQTTGQHHQLDFKAFQKSLVQRSKELKERTGAKKVSFKIVVKGGKVSLQAVAKN